MKALKSQRAWDVASFTLIGYVNIYTGVDPGWVIIPDSWSMCLGVICIALAAVRGFWGPR